MGLIYIIKNNINNKVYIGQTRQPLKRRWEHHLFLADKSDAVLYRAMRKYKKENFYITSIEEVDNNLLNEREVYWIEYYNSFVPNGYNSTRGGEGVVQYNYQEIIDYYINIANKNLTKTAEQFNCTIVTISNIIHSNNLEIQEHGSWSMKPIIQLDLDGNFIAEYKSATEAAKKLNKNVDLICSCANQNSVKKSAYGYQWFYKENYDKNKIYKYRKNSWQSIVCVETGEVFSSTLMAAEWIKKNNPTLKGEIRGMGSNIRRAIKNKIRAYKYHWKIIDQ